MGDRPAVDRTAISRRALLGTTAVGATSLSGCLERMRTTMAVDQPDPVSLSIKTVPADQDVVAARIARQLEKHLKATGVETELVTVRYDELMHDVLLNHNFDIFIGRFPEYHDPDFLRPVLHSRFSNESGWQNPFDFTDLDIDELLIDQRGQRSP